MSSSTKRVAFDNYVFEVPRDVYEPAEDSLLFAENLAVREDDVVLDMGTGCGILGIVAAEKASKIVAIDLNPYAVRSAKENAELNHVSDRILFLQGDLFTALKAREKFDLILFNAPYLPTEDAEDDSWLGRAWSGGFSGRHVIDRFVCEAPRYLKKSGLVFLMQSTLSNVDETVRRLEKAGLKASVVVKRDLAFFETLVLLKAGRQANLSRLNR